MLIQVGRNSYRIIKKRAYRKRTLINKRKGKSMIAYILGSFAVLTLLTAGYNQIPPNTWTWTSNDSFVDGKINLDNGEAYKSILDAPVAPKTLQKVKLDIIADETPKEAILRIAKENDFKWPGYLSRLAFYESSYNPKAINKNKNGSIDRGIFQWNDKAHPEIIDKCAFDIECATLEAMKAINEGHQSWWVADKKARIKKLN